VLRCCDEKELYECPRGCPVHIFWFFGFCAWKKKEESEKPKREEEQRR